MTDTSADSRTAAASAVTADDSVIISTNAYAARFDRNTFVEIYNRFRERVDRTLDVHPLYESVQLYKELTGEGWPEVQARKYTVGARICFQAGLDPATGNPLTGADLIHPLKIQEARKALVDATAMTGPDACSALDRLIELGWHV